MTKDWMGCPTCTVIRALAFADSGLSGLVAVDEVMDDRMAGIMLNLSSTEAVQYPIVWPDSKQFEMVYGNVSTPLLTTGRELVPEVVVVSPPPPAWVAMNKTPQVPHRGHSGSRRAHQGGTSHRRHG
jgi:hypothetical protein